MAHPIRKNGIAYCLKLFKPKVVKPKKGKKAYKRKARYGFKSD